MVVLLSPAPRPILARVMNRIELFGVPVLYAESGAISGRAAQRHRIALVALLATTRRLYRRRDQLVGLLWPDADAERGRRLLSDSIYRINQALGGDAIAGVGEDLRLDRQRIGSDVADFESAVEARDWRRVVELYAGPYLDGFFLPGAAEFDQWMENERAQYARTAAKAIEALAVESRDAGRVVDAAEWWHRLAVHVPDDSRVAMELMRALEAAGNRAGALRHARVHAVFLRESLGVEPDRSVQELAEQIARRGEAPPVPAFTNAVGAPPAVTEAERVSRVPVSSLATTTPVVQGGPGSGSSIAVLPFTNMSESEVNDYFADGMSEELMYLLTRIPGLRVASRTSAFAYRDQRLDVREVARRLDVGWILEGSVRRSGDRVRIVVQLTDARNGYQVWSDSFDRTSSDIFAIQGEIAGAVANRVEPAVSGCVVAGTVLDAGVASDLDTYELYLQARFQWHRRTADSLERSVALFDRVAKRDPGYARAWAGLADSYAVLGCYGYLAPREANPRAESAARHAIRLDPTLAAPHATLAYVDTNYHWNWVSAEQGFRRAIQLEPTNSTAHLWYSNLLATRGRFDEAERLMRRAAELDPLSIIANSAIGWVFVQANQNDRAIRQLKGAMRLDPDFCLAHYWMGLAYEQKGQPLEAIPCVMRALEISGESALGLAALARARAAAGHVDVARSTLHRLLELEKTGRYVSSYEVASVYISLGDPSAALERLEQAYVDRAVEMAFLTRDRRLRPLAGFSRFRKLIAGVEQSAA